MKISKIKKKKGFTLVELVITIAIIIVLSSISVPIYKNYVWNAKKSEGYMLLATIRDAQLNYRNEHGNFLFFTGTCSKTNNGWTCNETVLGIDARANKYYSWFYVNGWYGANLKDTFTCGVNCSLGQITMFYDVTSGATYKE